LRWADLPHLADRLDPVSVAVSVDEIHQDWSRRSSSAWGRNALANGKIAWAPAQLLDLAFQFLGALHCGRGHTVAHSRIDFLALDPLQQRLRNTADLEGVNVFGPEISFGQRRM
jgi:hypothetical protein